MSIVTYLSDTVVYGQSLGIMIFFYGFLFSGAVLCMGAVHRRRALAAGGYILAITDLLYLMCFFSLDMCRRIQMMEPGESNGIPGCIAVMALADLICITAVTAIVFAIRRFCSDKRYTM